MARDSSGVYTLPAGNPVVTGTAISTSWANTTLTDIGNELSNSIDKGGRTTITANLPMAGFKLTGLGAGSSAGQSLRYEQVSLLVADATVTLTATTSDIGASSAGTILLSGSGVTVTAFPAATVGTVKIVRFNGVNTLTDSAALDLPGSNITTASGDSAIFQYVTAGWKCVSYTTAAGIGTLLSSLGSAAAANSLSNGTFGQSWRWDITTGTNAYGLKLIGSQTGGTNQSLLILDNSDNGKELAYALRIVGKNAALNPADLLRVTSSGMTLTCLAGGNFTITSETPLVNQNGGSHSLNAGAGFGTGNGGTFSIGAGAKGGSGTVEGYLDFHTAGNESRLLIQNPEGITFAGTLKTVFDQKFVYADNTNGAPTISSGGGAGAVITGGGFAFELVWGTGSPTSVVVNYPNTWAATPQIILISGSQAGVTYSYSSSTTQLTINTSAAMSSGSKISVLVMGLQ